MRPLEHHRDAGHGGVVRHPSSAGEIGKRQGAVDLLIEMTEPDDFAEESYREGVP
jgi:hypothetical protein